MNSLYQQMTSVQSNNNLQAIKGMMQKVKMMTNPRQAVMDMAKSNPQMQAIMSLSQQKNMSLKDMFYSMAEQQGVNPEDILQALK